MIIITHRKPHLDEVVAAWLLTKFDPACQDCTYQFDQHSINGIHVPNQADYIGLGVGKGKYNEHNLLHGQSCAKLVYEDLLHRGLIPNEEFEDRALAWLVEYSHNEDTAEYSSDDPLRRSFQLPAIIRGIWLTQDGDQAVMREGLKLIDAVMARMNERAKFLPDWDRRIEFTSRYGKSVAVASEYTASDEVAYHHGFAVIVQKDTKQEYAGYRAHPHSHIDFTEIYEKLKALEPETWYLHQSKQVLITANKKDSGLSLTKLSLLQLIDLIKK